MGRRDTWTQRQRDAFNAQWRRWYHDNAARKIEWQTRRRDEIREWWRALKATKSCCLCGENAPECLHFHHVDPTTKKFCVGEAAAKGRSRKAVLAEAEKCVVLCVNCHAKYHWDERKWSG